MRLAARLGSIAPSATVAMTARAKAMVAAGVDVVGLSAGEPDFAPPDLVQDATIAALRAGHVGYTSVGGLPALREAAARWFSRLYGLPFGAAEIAVTVGGKEALALAFQALLDPGDEVIVPAPYWVSYPAQIRLAGGAPVVVPTRAEAGFSLDVEAIARACTERTRGVVINSPNNPSGAVYDRATLAALAEVVRARGLWVMSDDIYSALTYDGQAFASLLHVAPDLREQCVIVHGVAKNWGMTGYRVGFLGAPAALVKACVMLAGQSTTHTATFAQHGALAAIEAGEGVVADWLVAFDARRRRLTAGLDALPGISCALPRGAFYVFADVRGLLGRRLGAEVIGDDLQLAELLLSEAHVAVVPGAAFGMPGFLRVSYAASMEAIEAALARVGAFVGRLTP